MSLPSPRGRICTWGAEGIDLGLDSKTGKNGDNGLFPSGRDAQRNSSRVNPHITGGTGSGVRKKPRRKGGSDTRWSFNTACHQKLGGNP